MAYTAKMSKKAPDAPKQAVLKVNTVKGLMSGCLKYLKRDAVTAYSFTTNAVKNRKDNVKMNWTLERSESGSLQVTYRQRQGYGVAGSEYKSPLAYDMTDVMKTFKSAFVKALKEHDADLKESNVKIQSRYILQSVDEVEYRSFMWVTIVFRVDYNTERFAGSLFDLAAFERSDGGSADSYID